MIYGGRRKTAEMDKRKPDAPKKWRLILNYQDHTILQYEITHRNAGDEGTTPWEARALRKQGLADADALGGSDSTDDDGDNDDDDDDEGKDDWPLSEAA